MTTSASRLKELLRDIVTALQRHGVSHALVGGMAVAAHGLIRATKDIDFLIDEANADSADTALRSLGFEAALRTAGFVRYVRHPIAELPELVEWADLLLARQAIGRELLALAQQHPIQWEQIPRLPIVPVEGIILMKVLAATDDPNRAHDRSDAVALLRLHADGVDRRWIAAAAAQLGDDCADTYRQLEREATDQVQRNAPTSRL